MGSPSISGRLSLYHDITLPEAERRKAGLGFEKPVSRIFLEFDLFSWHFSDFGIRLGGLGPREQFQEMRTAISLQYPASIPGIGPWGSMDPIGSMGPRPAGGRTGGESKSRRVPDRCLWWFVALLAVARPDRAAFVVRCQPARCTHLKRNVTREHQTVCH